MQASSKTLESLLALLPRNVQQRYNPATWSVPKANIVLADIETETDPDFLKAERAILLLNGVTDYALDSSVRATLGLYEVLPGDVRPCKSYPMPFDVIGETLRLTEPAALTGTDDVTGTLLAGSHTTSRIYDNTSGKLDAFDINELKGRILRVTHLPGASQVVEDRIIVSNDPVAKTATINGAFSFTPASSDTYLISDNFLILAYMRYLRRFTSVTSVLDLPQDFEELFLCGMRWQYEKQVEEGSKEAQLAFQAYRAEKLRMKASFRKRMDSPRPVPRKLPRAFR